MSQELTVITPPLQIVNVAESALSIDQIVKQRQLITDVMAKAMREDQHYGKVPGCGDKPTLLQPGAQLLAHLFRLRPEYEVIESDLANGHKRFRVMCRLFFIGSSPEIKISEGVGESSSMESKHRFRNAAPVITPTGDTVPGTYWDIKHKSAEAAKKWAATFYQGTPHEGKNIGTKKIDGAWQFVIVEGGEDEKVENANPADVFNTVLKIAKKRAFVDATITATASSDFFTQDLEDIRENLAAVESAKPTNGATALVTSSSTGGTKKQAATSSDSAGSWREVLCTFGKKNGPLRGKKLGELNDDSLKYLADIWLVKGKEIKPGDRKMVAALGIWQASSRKVAAPASDDLPKFNGPNHEKLFELLKWENIAIDDFMAAMKAAKLIPEQAKSFARMTDETATTFVEDWEAAKVHFQQYLETKSKT
jgi:hypothetical protein